MGAVTLSVVKQGVEDNKRFVDVDVTFSNSYATNGDTIDTTQLRKLAIRTIDRAYIHTGTGQNDAGIGIELAGTATAPKLKCFATNNTEVANFTDQSTLSAVRIRLVGS